MSSSLDHRGRSVLAHPDTIERRASALVNPASGLANDFLNVYNEILMLIEMLPTMPELADDIVTWRPASYRAYFLQSQLPGRMEALEAYARLDPAFRGLFEASVENLAECGVASVNAIGRAIAAGAEDGDAQIAALCTRCGARLRARLHATEQLVNFGHAAHTRDAQTRVEALFSAA
jgi:hypothetical protein